MEATKCASCGATGTGKFCAECGAPLGGATCASCRAALSPGAKFCHRCGTAVGERAPRAAGERGLAVALPWAVAGIALLAVVSLVAGQRFARTRDAQPVAQSGMPGAIGEAQAAAPDISSMTPEEQAERLFNRVMSAFEQGDSAQVQFFAPMAVQAFERLPRKTADQRYHLGRIGAITGVPQLASVQADSILQADGQHLLGLLLAAQGARMRGDEGTARGYDRRLLSALDAQERRALPEYGQHANDIARAVVTARGPSGR
ncbi:MAG TPA: zinc ribbon domain-containing protein [Gemmatimonadaceae bacterium]|nr:zinc ribbon domain-containing protein [Gemmatimonadaceae bacterium]